MILMKFHISKFQTNLVVDDWGISCTILFIWMTLGFTDDTSTLFQEMALH